MTGLYSNSNSMKIYKEYNNLQWYYRHHCLHEHTLSTFVIDFLPMKKSIFCFYGCSHCPQVILDPKKIKSITISTFSPSIFCEVMEPDATILDF